jgi:hypothetical protein
MATKRTTTTTTSSSSKPTTTTEPGKQGAARTADGGPYGEGNYQATRNYNEATRRFVGAGKVDAAARAATPSSREEATALADAERAGKRRAKGEDPQVKRRQSRKT